MTRRYFAPTLPAAGGIISLDESESHHALHVMRIRVGDTASLFDGKGNQALAVVQSLGRKTVVFESLPADPVDRENRVHLTLGVAMPKGDRAKELVERLTELGVSELVPLHCQRTQWPVESNAIAKWERVILDACKQSGRNRVMTIARPVAVQAWLTLDTHDTGLVRLFAHPETDISVAPLQTSLADCRYAVAIGPEGGFSDEEVAVADAHGWQRWGLGKRTYRVETAAVIAAVKLAEI